MTRTEEGSNPPQPVSDDAPERHAAPPRLSGAVGRLAIAQVLGTLTALITGPLQARALGVDGRGLLAAVTVPLTLLPLLANLGLGVYTSRAAARGVRIGTLIASVAGILVAAGLLIALASSPLAALLGHQSDTAETFLWVGFLCARSSCSDTSSGR